MAAAKTTDTSCKVKLDVLTPGGPSLAYHVGWLVDGSLYVHGGIDKSGSKTPLNRLHRFNFESNTWSEIRSPGSPALSHHTCVIVGSSYAVIIGGWDGHKRTSDVHIFDLSSERWSSPATLGFPVGAGLSSHAAVLLSDGSIFVVGREGSLRIQRRFGSAFLLKGDPSLGATGTFQYEDLSYSVASRSGHSLHISGSTIVAIGGRDDKVVETHACVKSSAPAVCPCSTLAHLAQVLVNSPTAKQMPARKNHASACGSGIIFVHGGWTFDGRSRDPVGQVIFFNLIHTGNFC